MKKWLLLLIYVCISFISRAQECASMYVFNALDKTTYAVSCGENNEQGWVVSKNSCNFYTPLTSNNDETNSKWIDIKAIFSGSANLDARDFVWIFYYVNGSTVKTSTIKGENDKKTYDFNDSLLIPPGGSYRFRIAMVSDEADENWELGSGQLSICTRLTSGETLTNPVNIQVPDQNLISVSKDRGIAKLTWSAETGEKANYFKIERSKNGNQFELAGLVKENNPDEQLSWYSFIDAGPIPPQTWYRISKVSESGKETAYGEVVSVAF